MSNAWIEFVKKWAKKNNTTYSKALSNPKCKLSYGKKPSTALKVGGGSKRLLIKPVEKMTKPLEGSFMEDLIPSNQDYIENLLMGLEDINALSNKEQEKLIDLIRGKIPIDEEEEFQIEVKPRKKKTIKKAIPRKLIKPVEMTENLDDEESFMQSQGYEDIIKEPKRKAREFKKLEPEQLNKLLIKDKEKYLQKIDNLTYDYDEDIEVDEDFYRDEGEKGYEIIQSIDSIKQKIKDLEEDQKYPNIPIDEYNKISKKIQNKKKEIKALEKQLEEAQNIGNAKEFFRYEILPNLVLSSIKTFAKLIYSGLSYDDIMDLFSNRGKINKMKTLKDKIRLLLYKYYDYPEEDFINDKIKYKANIKDNYENEYYDLFWDMQMYEDVFTTEYPEDIEEDIINPEKYYSWKNQKK